jgi:hypothetical protein
VPKGGIEFFAGCTGEEGNAEVGRVLSGAMKNEK